MLLGREEERLALDRLLAEAREGRSGVLALVGEAGIGKTALLEYAVERAAGMRVLRARGVESEADVPFAGLAELLRPVLGTIERIPAPQAQALAGALALGPASAQDRFAIGAATLSLLSASAEERPLALFVDDAHLLDRSSAEALLFAARRLVADPIAVVLTVREGEPSLLDGSDLRVVRVPGLDRATAAELLLGAEVSGETVERLFLATAGNPLALLELAPEAWRLNTWPNDAPVPISTTITDVFVRRTRLLPESTRRMLVLAAAGDARELGVLGRAAAAIGLALDDLAPAEDAGLVSLDAGKLEFRHPLARSAVYADAAPQVRREAHAALAATMSDRDVDKRAWHLAAASVGPNEHAAAALEQAGTRACGRSAYAVAAGAFEGAARLAPSSERRSSLLFAAAEAAALAGDGARAVALLEEARLETDDLLLAARIDYLRGEETMRRGPVMDGYALIVAAAETIAPSDQELAVVMLAQAVHGCFYAGATREMVAAAERAVSLAATLNSPRAAFFAAMAHAMALVAEGKGDAGAANARAAVEILERTEELREDPRLIAWVALGPLWLREAESGRSLIDRAAERARDQAAVGALPAILHHLARDQATTDQWAAAETTYDEAIGLAGETGQRTELAAALAGLAWLEARQGADALCRQHAAQAIALCDELGLATYAVWAIQALGDLELGLARPEASIGHHETQAATLRERGIADVDLSPAPELVEAYLRLGRMDDAVETATPFLAAADAKGQPWVLARAARCRGLLAGDDAFEACFEEALERHRQTLDAFETGRTRLTYGARLRRARKRVRARAELRAALTIFDALGARTWAEQVRAELAATGETARRRDTTTADQLTPQERHIARLLAEGKTTREAAAAIFVSPKTIEYHLRHVYRKLGISSRDELAAKLAEVPHDE
jgi:DNA-binding CsgD family transcriptional regulator